MNRSRLFTRKLKRYLLFFAGRILLFLYAVFLYWRQREAVCLFLEYRNPLKFSPDGGRLPFLLIWCPFQTFLMKNKCCVSCRIYDWGHMMMFTPMAFLPGFFPRALFLTAALVWIRWELRFAGYPRQFNEESNALLRCSVCGDRTCRIKRDILRER